MQPILHSGLLEASIRGHASSKREPYLVLLYHYVHYLICTAWNPIHPHSHVICITSAFGRRTSPTSPSSFILTTRPMTSLKPVMAPQHMPRTTLYVFRQSSTPSSAGRPLQGLTFRRGTDADSVQISQSMAEAKMNPLFLDGKNFLVAEQKGQIQGFGQIRNVVGADNIFELASVYVVPEARKQGVGSQIVAKLVEEFKKKHKGKKEDRLVLLTLTKTTSFYEPHGFQVLPQPLKANLPPLLVFEFMAGSVVAGMSAKSSLVCMELTS